MDDGAEECGYFEGYSIQRFTIIATASAVSVLGILSNLLLLVIFIRSLRTSLYLVMIALLDCLLCTFYVLLFGVDAGFVFLRNATLFTIYHTYIMPAFIVSRITQFAMPYMLILATFERFVWTAGTKTKLSVLCSNNGKVISVSLILFISIILRLPIVFAIEVKSFENCTDFFRSLSVYPTEWAIGNRAYYIFDFHIISFIQTLLPFIILIALNALIIWRILATKRKRMSASRISAQMLPKRARHLSSIIQQHRRKSNFSTEMEHFSAHKDINHCKRSKSIRKNELKSAVNTMIAIVFSYLICNSLHLLLTFMEHSGSQLLVDGDDPNISSNTYIALSDTISFCYMFTSAIRIIIHCVCNQKIRQNIKNFLCEVTQFWPLFNDQQNDIQL